MIYLWDVGASSGLHHDYHDNLYVLVKGKKAFHLWSPADAHSLYTHGKIARVHANGRIVYNGEVGPMPYACIKNSTSSSSWSFVGKGQTMCRFRS